MTEKPKAQQPKAPGRRRTTRIHVPGDPDAPAVAPEVLQDAIAEPQVEAGRSARRDGVDASAEDDSAPEADANGAAARRGRRRCAVVVKRKTRRGSRGGKNRRKKPAGAAAGLAAEGEAETDGEAAVAVAVIESDVTDTRRGLRPTRPRSRSQCSSRSSRSSLPSRAGRSEPVAETDAEPDEPSAAESERSGLRADVRVARRFRPQVMAAFRYTPSACGHLPAFSAPESTLP